MLCIHFTGSILPLCNLNPCLILFSSSRYCKRYYTWTYLLHFCGYLFPLFLNDFLSQISLQPMNILKVHEFLYMILCHLCFFFVYLVFVFPPDNKCLCIFSYSHSQICFLMAGQYFFFSSSPNNFLFLYVVTNLLKTEQNKTQHLFIKCEVNSFTISLTKNSILILFSFLLMCFKSSHKILT